ncbi:MAG: glycosyltransferase family protein [Planctomycetota bacterium]
MNFSTLQSMKVIEEVEKNFDVNSLFYKNLRVWPLIRAVLEGLPQRLEHPEFYDACEESRPKDRCSIILPDQQQLADLAQYRDVDYMFISRIGEHQTKTIESKFYNPWIDPYIEIVKDRHSFLKIELPAGPVETTSPRYIPTVLMRTLSNQFYFPVNSGDITGFDRLREYVLSLCEVDLETEAAAIIRSANSLEQFKLYFLDLLSQIRPKAVVFVCYYGDVQMGLSWACRELNITSVDLQHGYRANNLYYERWSRIPAEGYELLPDIFYVWSKVFKERIERTYTDGFRQPQVIVGNNGWMSKVIQDEPLIDDIDEGYFDYLKSWKKVMLVTFGAWATMPEHLLEAMRRLPDDWLWLIRFHPDFKDKMQEIREFLHSLGIDNVEIENATEYPLFLLLKYSHHHLTAFSTSCLEAMLYGVPTTFFLPIAYDRFKEHIDMGFFNYEPLSADTLVRFLSFDYDKDKIKNLSKYFFDMDKYTGQKAFEDILYFASKRAFCPVPYNYRAENLNQAGNMLYSGGDSEKALQAFLNATRVGPNETESYNNLGALCWQMGKVADAAKCIKVALKIDATDKLTLQNYHELLKVKNRMPPEFNELLNGIELQL